MRRLVIALVVAVMVAVTCSPAFGATSDYDLAKAWMNKHCKGGHIEKVNTTAKGGYKGKVNGTKYTVRYPKKVKKGKKVRVYMVVKHGDVEAMVCLGKVK